MSSSQLIPRTKRISLQFEAGKYGVIVILSAIMVLAIYLRFSSMAYGSPLIYGDENPIVEHSLALSWSDLNPHMFYYGSLTFYVFKLVSIMASFVNSTFAGHALTFPDYILILRYVSAIASTITIGLAFVFGKLLIDTRIGLLSAAVFAFSPLAIELAHNATVDALLGAWSGLALVGMALWLRGDKSGRVIAAIGTGLAITTKFNAAILLVAIFLIAWRKESGHLGHTLDRRRKIAVIAIVALAALAYVVVLLYRSDILALVASWSTRGQLQPAYVELFDRLLKLALVAVAAGIVLAVGVMRDWRWTSAIVRVVLGPQFLQPLLIICAIFALTSPFVILDFPAFVRDFFFQIHKSAASTVVAYDIDTRSYQAAMQSLGQYDRLQYFWALRDEWGILVFLALFVGGWGLWYSSRTAFLPIVALCLLCLTMTVGWSYLALRWLYPLWAIFTTLAGLGIGIVLTRVAQWMRPRQLAAVLGCAVLLLVFYAPLISSFGSLRSNFLLPDTRNLAFAWIEEHVPPGTTILRELETTNVELLTSDYHVYATDTAFEEAPLAEWRKRGVSVVLLSDRRYQFYQDHAAAFEDVLRDYNTIKTSWRLAGSFTPGSTMAGMPVHIYVSDEPGKP